MTFSSGRGISSEINVTPMIDVLLVVLTIFMAITPVVPTGLEALLPRPPKGNQAVGSEQPVVLQILHTGTGQIIYKVNQTEIARNQLWHQLATIFSTRSTKVLFIAGDGELDFGPIAGSIDLARRAGVEHVGLITHRTTENR